ncbi:peptidoglycan-associated lipoprotein Pal [Thauera mechernichensis]|uniref:Peptidoglycan-associated lipoprotein n=1 Tax=Thauera mechernichensis TaxID=82788 RepID=A0ABW3W9W7_9RHOO|nr:MULTISPECIES: peptidoglycan-associated lipoprotein Pal [Thauera]HAG75568.1 peptidoglycan-associated lipoprotein Pal [Thauera sp.]ENO80548.1 outer membrane protein, porin-associated lipoprotein [Thauera sp. 27]ENO93824.1 outer membrane protein, porin-associated lipoprotein [Thauera sp. 28]MDG3064191.1 peptidoglycan-associated lipoprotein Pal [Thauera mechernichensis]WBL63771.1 peptidoglycan-associated lipoprotein Pal [Thauera sp. WB-2]
MKKLVLPALIALTLAACSSTGTDTAGASVEDRGAGVATVTAPGMSGSGIAALTDPNNILSKRSVFFDFDSYVIKPEGRPLIEAHARFLVQNPEMRMLVQGNTDERGSREYNLALGQKRADVVKQALMLLGAREAQIESVSLGEEKPRCDDRTETCYAENRRGDMLYSGEF